MSNSILSRNNFINSLIERKSEWLPDIWKKAEVFLKPPADPNLSPECGHLIVIRDPDLWDDLQIDIDSFYRLLKDGIPLDDVISHLSYQSFPWRLKDLSWDEIRDYETAKHYTVFTLMPTGDNGIARNTENYLSLPVTHTDLRLCVNVLRRNPNGRIIRVPVTKGLADIWQQDIREIFQTAYTNAPSLQPAIIRPYTNWIYETTGCVPHQDIITENAWVVTNMDHCCGAAAFLYPGVMIRVQDLLQTDDIYIIPLNMNLSLAIPQECDTPLNLLAIVKAMQLGDTNGNLYLTTDVLEEDGKRSWQSAIYKEKTNDDNP